MMNLNVGAVSVVMKIIKTIVKGVVLWGLALTKCKNCKRELRIDKDSIGQLWIHKTYDAFLKCCEVNSSD